MDRNGLENFKNEIAISALTISICFTFNPVTEICYERSPNKLTPYVKVTTKDKETEKLNFLHIDLDPKRPAKTSPTELEKAAAEKMAKRIAKFLDVNYRMKKPIFASSGNGYNLDYFLGVLENTAENKALLKKILHYLHILFQPTGLRLTLRLSIRAVSSRFSAAKQSKAKAPLERPHRLSGIESLPEELAVVPIGSLKRLAQISDSANMKGKSRMDLKKYLDEHNITVYKTKEKSDRTIYVLDDCPWDKEHNNHSAFAVQFQNGNVHVGCHHNGCAGKGLKDFLAIHGSPLDDEKTTQAEDDTGAVQKCVDCIEPYITCFVTYC